MFIRIFIAYLIVVNLIGFALYGIDKAKSKGKGRRIPERTLFLVAAIGGALGCWLGMMLFRHKTKHIRFKVLVPLLTVVWTVAVVLLVWYWK